MRNEEHRRRNHGGVVLVQSVFKRVAILWVDTILVAKKKLEFNFVSYFDEVFDAFGNIV